MAFVASAWCPICRSWCGCSNSTGNCTWRRRPKSACSRLRPATADRLLQAERKRAKPHGLGTTKPGTLLKSAIPIRTFAEWDEAEPGFTEIDLARALWKHDTRRVSA